MDVLSNGTPMLMSAGVTVILTHCRVPIKLLLWVTFRRFATPSETSAPGGEADEFGDKADVPAAWLRLPNLARTGQSSPTRVALFDCAIRLVHRASVDCHKQRFPVNPLHEQPCPAKDRFRRPTVPLTSMLADHVIWPSPSLLFEQNFQRREDAKREIEPRLIIILGSRRYPFLRNGRRTVPVSFD